MDCDAEAELVRMRLTDMGGIDRIAIELPEREAVIEHRTDTGLIDAALQDLGLGAVHVGDGGVMPDEPEKGTERRSLTIALAINAGFFIAELAFGLISRSMSLVADALDMGADASVYALSLAAVGSTTTRKHRLARTSGHIQLVLAAIGLAEAARRAASSSGPPDATTMIVVSLFALAGNIATLFILQKVRTGEAHLEASWIFTANDIKVNTLIITAAIIVALTNSAVPDLIAGALIFVIIANGARRILTISRPGPSN